VLWLSWEGVIEPKPARAQTTGTCPNAQLIDTFEGNGTQQTDTFNTTTDSFRVSFTSGPGLLIVELKQAARDRVVEFRLSPTTILKLEADRVEDPHPRTVRKLAEALEVDPTELVED
jgi:hypothetical protein